MKIKLYNTLTRELELFEPHDSSQVKLYSCGPTVYDYTHIGHLRKYMMDDLLVRVLRKAGYQVKFVQNVTDVGHLVSDEDTGEDKLEKGAKKYQLDVYALAEKFEDYFYRSMKLMNNQRPDVVCRATEHIDEMKKMVEELEKKGFTYVIEGDGVYFDVSKFEDYTDLSGVDLEELKEGARVDKIEDKRNPADFALWKFERPGENRQMAWSSKWAERSFPGWHIECSAMSMKYLGEQLDIHTGGIDHITVHHPNEIAQSECCTGKKPFVKYWVHHNFLQVDGEKMSKSLGNFYTIDDVLERGFEPMALRLLFLGAHHRSEMNFTWDSLHSAQVAWEKLKKVLRNLSRKVEMISESVSHNNLINQYQQDFFEKAAHDLNLPASLAIFWRVVKDKELHPQEKVTLLMEFDEVLGLNLKKVLSESFSEEQTLDIESLPDEVQQLIAKREDARGRKNYQQADRIREKIKEFGYEVEDLGDEVSVKRCVRC